MNTATRSIIAAGVLAVLNTFAQPEPAERLCPGVLYQGRWPQWPSGYAKDVAARGHYAFVALGSSGGLVVFDITNPTNCVPVGGYDTSGYAQGVAAAGKYAYVADGNAGLQVIDVSDPTNCVRVGGYDMSGAPNHLVAVGTRVYVARGAAGLLVLDWRPFNHYPTASTGATRSAWVAPNGLGANVVLDGSGSSDPDGDPLQYLWLLVAPKSDEGRSTLLASSLVAVVPLPVGIHPILLVVDDGLATATNAVTVEVITTAQALQRFTAHVESSWRRSPPLVATLSAALASLERGNVVSAINQLQAFQNKVRAQVAPSDPALAARLLQEALKIIDALSGGQTNPGSRSHGRLKAKHQPNGQVQLQLTAERGTICIVEASTNLVHWEKIGIGIDHGHGTFSFDDPNATRFRNRFYRVVAPE
jgi:hypothetical protein